MYLIKAKPCDSVGEAFACDALVTEQKDAFFNECKHLFLIGADMIKCTSACHLLAPSTADGHAIAGGFFFDGAERAFADTSAAMVALIGINEDLAVDDTRKLDRARLFDLTNLTVAAFFSIHIGNALADDADIVEIGLDAVVGTTADGDFEFMRELYVVIALIKTFVNFFTKAKSINKTKLAGCTLT